MFKGCIQIMKFEEALSLMRGGKKITHAYLGEDVYLQACHVKFVWENTTPIEEQSISIVKMQGDRQHIDMFPNTNILIEPCKHGNCPQLNLFLVMSNDWEIVE